MAYVLVSARTNTCANCGCLLQDEWEYCSGWWICQSSQTSETGFRVSLESETTILFGIR